MKSLYLRTLIATTLVIHSQCRLSYRRLLRPLIGGPRWLKLHQALEVKSSLGGIVEFDFVPRRPGSISDLLTLLAGSSVEGLVRQRAVTSSTEAVMSEELLMVIRRIDQSEFSTEPKLNLYRNNCFTFVEFCLCVLREENSKT
jgi:hypothetical protein